MPLRKSSREFQFINTSHPDKRTFLLKSPDKIKELPDKSTDIESDNALKRYQKRPRGLSDVCLADFVAWINCSKDNNNYSPIECSSELKDSDEYILKTDFNKRDDEPVVSDDTLASPSIEYQMKGGFRLVRRKNKNSSSYLKSYGVVSDVTRQGI